MVLGRTLGMLDGPGWSLGCSFGVSGGSKEAPGGCLGRSQTGPNPEKVLSECLGGGLMVAVRVILDVCGGP